MEIVLHYSMFSEPANKIDGYESVVILSPHSARGCKNGSYELIDENLNVICSTTLEVGSAPAAGKVLIKTDNGWSIIALEDLKKIEEQDSASNKNEAEPLDKNQEEKDPKENTAGSVQLETGEADARKLCEELARLAGDEYVWQDMMILLSGIAMSTVEHDGKLSAKDINRMEYLIWDSSFFSGAGKIVGDYSPLPSHERESQEAKAEECGRLIRLFKGSSVYDMENDSSASLDTQTGMISNMPTTPGPSFRELENINIKEVTDTLLRFEYTCNLPSDFGGPTQTFIREAVFEQVPDLGWVFTKNHKV